MSRYLATQTVSFRDDEGWGEGFTVVDEAQFFDNVARHTPAFLKPHLVGMGIYGFYLLWKARQCDGVSLGRYGALYPLLRRLFFGRRQRIFMTDTEWREGRGVLNRLVARFADGIQSNTRAEIRRYSRYFHVDPSKFIFLPLAYQRRDVFPGSDDGFVISGGRQGRDWSTLVKALGGEPYRVEVYSDNFRLDSPPNFVIDYVTRQHFYTRIGRASCVVLPVVPENCRVTATTTWTNAMAMGKVVVVAEPEGAPDYIDSGYNGFVVPYGDASAIRECVSKLMSDADLRARMGRRAKESAIERFSPEVFKRAVGEFIGAD